MMAVCRCGGIEERHERQVARFTEEIVGTVDTG
jgi:hypothetical protein